MTATQDAPQTSPQPAAPAAPLEVEALVDRIDAGHRLTEAEALAALRTSDAETFALVAAASRLREKHLSLIHI